VARILTSDWTGLSSQLIASFYPVQRQESADKKSFSFVRVPDSVVVQAPLTDGSMDNTINWHSPFEGASADQKYSSLSALLQQGSFEPLMAIFSQMVAKVLPGMSGAVDAAAATVKGLEGRSGVTKLNSTQVFNGLPPAKLTFTAHFRAMKDPYAEVHEPINQLVSWALPRKLADDGVLLALAKKGTLDLYPSLTPTLIAMNFAGQTFLPMVIESVPVPLTGPRDKDGRMLSAQITMSIATLSALDAPDWVNINQGVKK
jgi:hypothetical protein